MKNRQAEAIKTLSDRELLLNVYLTQFVLVALSFVGGFFLFREIWFLPQIFDLRWIDMIVFGGGAALLIISIDLVLMKVLPESAFDDGGINERIFGKRSIFHIFVLSLLISISEELMFRGVLQTHFGLVMASLLFAIIHVRYLTKPVLFSLVVGISFLLGIVYKSTGNIAVTITAHFLIDFIMGCLLKFKASK
ncbi:CPBP family intramembrane glutamic endopeptidase [Guptibacillus algicola]|uniref:CPBP family intramembrane glutamic endopeptidase n=1 Tax=Guptibacillus algicola TaxID=225844 RepID=UPI001CD5DA07|nr:type II CAAX endopeptidase family protein [Alkalihalobacillus algicola]MCA0985823.1 CPBP family intramembrane metalloprotease [Alkalihalobacillus algicola]